MNKTVSIIIPTYNRKNALTKVIGSYLIQKHLYELIFVDDGSTDGTYEYLKKYEETHPVIKIKRHGKTEGASNSRNEGINIASGSHILFGEDDVYLAHSYVSALLNCMDETDADLVAGRIFYGRKGETIEDTIRRFDKPGGALINYWLMSGDYSINTSKPIQAPFLHAISLGKTEVCRHIRFDEAFFAREETDFYLRASEVGYKMIFCPHTVCVHLQRDREKGGGWRVGILKYQYLATRNNNMLVDRHYNHFRKWGMKGNKITFKLLHLLNRIRIVYLYYRFSVRHSKYRIGFLMHGARNIGGGEKSLFSLIKHMRKDIFEPIVFYAAENNVILNLRTEGIKVVKLPFNEAITSVYRDQIKKDPLTLLAYFYYLIQGVVKVAKFIRKYEIDILHPHDNLSKIIGGIAGKFCRVKAVTHCRDQLGLNILDRMLGIWQIMMMDRIIAVSNCVKNILLSYKRRAENKIRAVYDGVDLTPFPPSHYDYSVGRQENGGARDIVIGVIGVFDKVKGHTLLFEALRRLKEQNIGQFRCLVIGAGRDEVTLRNYVEESRLGNEVYFLGFRDDIPELLRQIDIIVVPSKREAFGIVILEAMAAHVPVIATKVGGIPEIVDHGLTGILVPPEDADSLSKAIKYLMENPEIRRRMGEAGRKKVENNFGFEMNIRETEKIYLDVLKN